MTKRHTKSLSFFCFPTELQLIVETVTSEFGMQLCSAEKRSGRWYLCAISFMQALESRRPECYLCSPEMIEPDGLESLAYKVQVWLPVLTESSLQMGVVSLLVDQRSESDKQLHLRQLNAFRRLGTLLSDFQRGVSARNSNTGAEHYYKDILISDAVAEANAKGLVLAPQLGGGFVTYSATGRKQRT
jgi:hypothetical protein